MIHTVCKWNRLSGIILPRLNYGLGESFMQKRLGKLGSLQVDFGEELEIRKSSAQMTKLYQPDDLIGKLAVAVNFLKKQISPIQSKYLVTDFHNLEGMLCFVS